MLKAGYSKPLATGVIATSGTLAQVIPPSIVLVLLGAMVGDIYSKAQKARSEAQIYLCLNYWERYCEFYRTLFKAVYSCIVLAIVCRLCIWNCTL